MRSSSLPELKKKYPRYMIIAFGISAVLHLSLAGILAMIFSVSPAAVIIAAGDKHYHDRVKFIPPPLPKEKPSGKYSRENKTIPVNIGLALPVPDTEIVENSAFPDQKNLIALAPNLPGLPGDGGYQLTADQIIDKILPGPEDFVPYDIAPVQVVSATPLYPPLARRAGIEGDVWVKALIGTDGQVLDAVIFKNSETNAGFEEAAIKAARLNVWKPAVANGIPVAVWIAYKVSFRLR